MAGSVGVQREGKLVRRREPNPARAFVAGLVILTAVASLPYPAATAHTPHVKALEAHALQVETLDHVRRGSLSTRSAEATPPMMMTGNLGRSPERPPTASQEVLFLPEPTPLPTPAPIPTPVPVPQTLWPVPGGMLSQYFHAAHLAIDIAAQCGSAAIAVWGGTVSYAGWKDNGGGYVVDIVFDNGLVGSYNHLQAIYVAGGYVPAGTVLGEVGATGLATGCHLHFAVIENGIFVNPLLYVG